MCSPLLSLDQLTTEQTNPHTAELDVLPLEEALRIAAEQPEEVQDGLFVATDNDVVAYLDLVEG